MDRASVAGTRTPADTSQHELLRIYLSDHYAGACAGAALIGRLVMRHGGTDMEPDLRWLQEQIVQDQRALREIMERLGVQPVTYKNFLAMAGERVARLKPNGHLLRPSPLSTLIELEAMQLGVNGKRSGWESLRTLATHLPALDEGNLGKSIERAEEQTARLEQLRRTAAVRALGTR